MNLLNPAYKKQPHRAKVKAFHARVTPGFFLPVFRPNKRLLPRIDKLICPDGKDGLNGFFN